MKNVLGQHWEKLEKEQKHPENIRNVQTIDVGNFYKIFEDKLALTKIIDDIYAGDFIIIKNAINRDYLNNLKSKLHDISLNSPSEYHEMLEGCPNFHRFIDQETSKKYSLQTHRHSFYFFRWNKDDLKLFDNFDSLWGNIKKLGGLKFDEYVKNTPKDIVVDRVQIVRYPEKTGFIEPHQHTPINQRLIISVYMSKQGKDYKSGGTYFYNDNQKIEVEDKINIGDCGIFYATLKHSVDPVELLKQKLSSEEEKTKGRWWIGLYSPESNHKKNRNTSNPKN